MRSTLLAVEDDILNLLDTAPWNSLDITYHPPRVERMWIPWGTCRVYLHRIHPCDEGSALFHPHPWPSAIRILSGRYETGVGYGAGDTPPPVAWKGVLEAGSYYEMVEPDGWHWVRPVGGPSLSLMVTGAPWTRTAPRSSEPLAPLAPEAAEALRRDVRNFYLGKTPCPTT